MTYYNPEKRRELLDQWTTWMEDWQGSGMSGAAWCKQKQIPYHRFTYWKKRLCPEANQIPNPSSFLELEDRSESSGIEIVLDSVYLRLTADFDTATLHRCLKVLREAKC